MWYSLVSYVREISKARVTDLTAFTTSANIGFHRAQFINLLVDLLSRSERAKTHFGKRCISFTERSNDRSDPDGSGGEEDLITLKFTDGSSAACDVLVGCDGIKSAVRGQLMCGDQAGDRAYPGTRFSGTVAYRALVKPDDLRAVAGEHTAITIRKMVRFHISAPVAN